MSQATPSAPVSPAMALLKRLDYSFALRSWLATLLAWAVAYLWHLDKPYWAMMTVAIVSYPSQGMLIAKFFARLAGTLVGIVVVTRLADISLSDPWRFSLLLSLWLALCTYIAGYFSGMVTYACALCGYTSAIVGFGISVSPSPYSVFFISQARLSEIVVGLCAALLVTFLLPSRLDNRLYRQAIGQQQAMRKNFFAFLSAFRPAPALFSDFYHLVIGLMGIRLLAINDYLSLVTEKFAGRYCDTDRQMENLAGLLSLRTMTVAVLNEAGRDSYVLTVYLRRLSAWLPETSWPPSGPPPESPVARVKGPAAHHLRRRIDESLQALVVNPAGPVTVRRRGSRLLPGRHFHDHWEMLLNAARTFSCVLLSVLFWLGTRWDLGYILPVLVGISCALGAHFPAVNKLVLVVLAAVLLAVPVAYILLFYCFISSAEIVPAMLVMSPVLLIAGVGKSASQVLFIFFHVFLLALIFLINFANPMDYDFSRFANVALAAVFSVMIVALIFNLIPPGSDGARLARMRRALAGRYRRAMTDSRRHTPFAPYVGSLLYSSRLIADGAAKQQLVRLCCATVAMVDIRQRARRQDALSLSTPPGFNDALLAEHYQDCLAMAAQEMREPAADILYWWEIRTLLAQLQAAAAEGSGPGQD